MKTKLFIQIFLSTSALAVGAWAFYEYKKSQTEQKQKAKAELFLPNLKLKELKAFQIIRKINRLSAKQKDSDWFLSQPVKDQADFKEISRWFDEIKNQKVQKIQMKNIDWKNYDLDQAPSVKMNFANGKSLSFSVSAKSSFDDKYFIKKEGELFIGEKYFFTEVNEKDFDSFRNKKILPSLSHATQIKFQGKHSLTLYWADYKWSMDKEKNKFPLDSNRLDDFWTEATSLKADEIKESVSPSSLKKYGLHKPQLKILFAYPGKEKPYILKLSPFKKDKAFMALSHRDFIFEISKEEMKKLILSQNDIRDHNFPFDYNINSASQIKRQNKDKSFAIQKEKNSWRFLNKKEQPSKRKKGIVALKQKALKDTDSKKSDLKPGDSKDIRAKRLDLKKVEDLLDKIKNLKGKKYKKAKNARQALRSIVIKNTDNKTIFELKEISLSASYSWLKTNLWPDELIAVSRTAVDEIFNHSITSGDITKKDKTN